LRLSRWHRRPSWPDTPSARPIQATKSWQRASLTPYSRPPTAKGLPQASRRKRLHPATKGRQPPSPPLHQKAPGSHPRRSTKRPPPHPPHVNHRAAKPPPHHHRTPDSPVRHTAKGAAPQAAYQPGTADAAPPRHTQNARLPCPATPPSGRHTSITATQGRNHHHRTPDSDAATPPKGRLPKHPPQPPRRSDASAPPERLTPGARRTAQRTAPYIRSCMATPAPPQDTAPGARRTAPKPAVRRPRPAEAAQRHHRTPGPESAALPKDRNHTRVHVKDLASRERARPRARRSAPTRGCTSKIAPPQDAPATRARRSDPHINHRTAGRHRATREAPASPRQAAT
jgi:hypothetical protein